MAKELGKDISQKIRSAIKAKLIELSAYVDDELPDYIMVMVANKKSEQQMTDDLGLFLGPNTERFTEWLHNLLQKLQTVGSDKPKDGQTEGNKEKGKSSSKSKRTSTETKAEGDIKSDTKKTGDKGKVKVKDTSQEKSLVKEAQKENPNENSSVTDVQTVAWSKSVRNPKVTYIKSVKEAKKGTQEEENVLELLIDKEEPTDEFAEEGVVDESTMKTNTKKTDSTKVRPTSKERPESARPSSTSPQSNVQTVKPQSAVDRLGPTVKSTTIRTSDPDAPKLVKKKKTVVKKKSGEEGVPVKKAVLKTTTKRKASLEPGTKVVIVKKKPVSVVGVVKRKYQEQQEDSDQEYDPYRPAVGSVSSVIKVKRTRVAPSSIQPNKSLLLKAVNDAEKSVSSTLQKVLREEKMYSEKEGVKSRLGTTRPQIVPSFFKRERTLEKPTSRISDRRDLSPVRKEPTTSMVKQESRLASVKPIQVTVTGKRKDMADVQLVSKVRRQEMLSTMKYTIKNEPGTSPKKTPEVARVPPVMDSRRVECDKPATEEAAVEDEDDKSEEDASSSGAVDSEVGEENAASPASQGDEEQEAEEVVSETKGSEVGEEIVEESDEEEEEEVKDEKSGQLSPEADPEIRELFEAENTELDVPVYKQENKRVIKEKSKVPIARVNPKFIVTLDGVDHAKYEGAAKKAKLGAYEAAMSETTSVDDEEDDEDEEEKVAVKRKSRGTTHKHKTASKSKEVPKYSPPAIKPISINLQDSDDDEMPEEGTDQGTEETPLMKAKQTERCKFWPACVNGNSCEYHHPTTSCKMFPHCKFAEKCLYIHPNCKYDAVCTRQDCPFTHASRRSNLATVIQKIVPVPMATQTVPGYRSSQNTSAIPPWSAPAGAPVCRFFPACTNLNCHFRHPKQCRFGVACVKKEFCAFYHPPLPTKDKMRWTSSTKPSVSSSHVSQRHFDSSRSSKS